MSFIFRSILIAAIALLLHACAHHQPCPPPSEAARHMPGARGMIEYKPDDFTGQISWWKDSDGIEPGIAGCHIGTDDEGNPNGRMFSEACLESGLLVESNPGKDELHAHKNDLGHPDTFDCVGWCRAQGKQTGACEKAPAPPCASSAICACR